MSEWIDLEIRLPKSLKKRIEEEARVMGISVSEWIRRRIATHKDKWS